MKPVRIVLAGAGGYGDFCLALIETCIPKEQYQLAGVVDPYASAAPRYRWFLDNSIPIYDSLEDFYMEDAADLAYICSPVHLHAPECRTALLNGSHVLCEKPITPFWEDAAALQALADSRGLHLGVGFQWSFAPAMKRAKQDILSGKYGEPKLFKVLVAWPRYDAYYQSGWKGRVRDSEGEWTLDSVVSNGLSHYLHNLLFMAGDTLERSCMPQTLMGSVYRASEIETFETCLLRGRFANGLKLLYLATHSGERKLDPMLEYTFERGRVMLDMNGGAVLRGELYHGGTVEYGELSTPESDAGKIKDMMEAALRSVPPACTARTALPHLTVCNALFEQMGIVRFPPERLYRSKNPAGSFVRGLSEDLLMCFNRSATPYELGFSWAAPEQPVYTEKTTKKGIMLRYGINVSQT